MYQLHRVVISIKCVNMCRVSEREGRKRKGGKKKKKNENISDYSTCLRFGAEARLKLVHFVPFPHCALYHKDA